MMGPMVDGRWETVIGAPDWETYSPVSGVLLPVTADPVTVLVRGDLYAMPGGGYWYDTNDRTKGRAYAWRWGTTTNPADRFTGGPSSLTINNTRGLITVYPAGIPETTAMRHTGIPVGAFQSIHIWNQPITETDAADILRRLPPLRSRSF